MLQGYPLHHDQGGNTQAEVRKKLAQVTNSIGEGLYIEPTKFSRNNRITIKILFSQMD